MPLWLLAHDGLCVASDNKVRWKHLEYVNDHERCGIVSVDKYPFPRGKMRGLYHPLAKCLVI